MESLVNLDVELFLWLNNLGSERWDYLWLAISGIKTWIPLYALLLILLYRTLSLKSFLLAIVVIVLNVLATDQGSTHLFKEYFERLRPCHNPEILEYMRLVKSSCGGWYGFVSAHAANTFGLSVLVGLLSKQKFAWILPLLLIWSSIVAYSRIYLGVHYPLDISVGALYGSICGTAMFYLHKFLIKKI